MNLKYNLLQFKFILDKNCFGHLSTLLPDGTPHSAPLWIDYNKQDNEIKISIEKDSIKDKNITFNSHVSLSITDPDNPYHYVQIRGKVVTKKLDEENKFSNSLFKKYSNGKITKSWFDYPKPLYIVSIKPLYVTGWSKESAYNFYDKMNAE